MASKFMINSNSAFKGRLLLRPPHQRTVLFGTAYKPLIRSSRTYSESVPKDSEPVQRSQSSGHEDKDKNKDESSKAEDQSSKAEDQSSKAKGQIYSFWMTFGIGSAMTGGIFVRAGLFYVPFRIC